jgi:Fe-S cluster assembly iron-binding protein IscA
LLTITQRAAEELRAITSANAADSSHVLRIDTESDGFSLWLGPEMEGDTVAGSEDTVLLRVSPELSEYLVEASVIIDCRESTDGLRLVVYREDEPQLHASPPKPRRRSGVRRKTKQRRPTAGD